MNDNKTKREAAFPADAGKIVHKPGLQPAPEKSGNRR